MSVHAEQNAMNLADKLGIELDGSTIYTTLAPCIRCIDNLARKGVTSVYYELAYRSIDPDRDTEWERLARQKFANYEQISLSDIAKEKLVGAIVGMTSERLLPSE